MVIPVDIDEYFICEAVICDLWWLTLVGADIALVRSLWMGGVAVRGPAQVGTMPCQLLSQPARCTHRLLNQITIHVQRCYKHLTISARIY